MGEKTVSVNRKASHDYHILRTVEAGLSLLGTEIKSIRDGHVSIREAYVLLRHDAYRRLAGRGPGIRELLGQPGAEDIEFDPPRFGTGIFRPPTLS